MIDHHRTNSFTRAAYLRYCDRIPPQDRSQKLLDHHNAIFMERWRLIYKDGLCEWCAKLDLEQLRKDHMPMDWDSFEVSEAHLAIRYCYGWRSEHRKLSFTSEASRDPSLRTATATSNLDQDSSAPQSDRPNEQDASEKKESNRCPVCKIMTDVCLELGPKNQDFEVTISLKRLMVWCLPGCDKEDSLRNVDVIFNIPSAQLTHKFNLLPLLPQPRSDRSPRHACTAKYEYCPEADFECVYSLLKTCDEEHKHVEPADVRSERLLPFFIDVVDKCIIQQSLKSKYATLSYTWGSQDQFKLTQERLNALKEPGSLLRYQHELAKVVIDAMEACRRLEIRYLWIDALCIVDDDYANKVTQLENMDLIYSLAYVTFIAAATDRYGARFSRVGVEFVHLNRTLTINNLRYELADSHVWRSRELDLSSWSFRGWTFQELVLSRRVVALTENEAYFCCGEGYPTIALHTPNRNNPGHRFGAEILDISNSVKPQLAGRSTSSIGTLRDEYETKFWDLLNIYLLRILKYTDDILFAFAGVMTAHAATLGDFHFGLPKKLFVRSLFWDLSDYLLMHPGTDHIRLRPLSKQRRVGFPSWSWAGWQFQDHPEYLDWTKRTAQPRQRQNRSFEGYLQNLVHCCAFSPLVQFYTIAQEGFVPLMANRSEEDGVEGILPEQLLRFNDRFRAQHKRDFKNESELGCKRQSHEQAIQLNTEIQPSADNLKSVQRHHLVFFAVCAMFRVSIKPEHIGRNGNQNYGLYEIDTWADPEYRTEVCPRIWLDIKWREQQDHFLEFVLLGVDIERAEAEEQAYWAMLIERKFDGVAERVAIPQPFTLDQWQRGHLTSQWVTLE